MLPAALDLVHIRSVVSIPENDSFRECEYMRPNEMAGNKNGGRQMEERCSRISMLRGIGWAASGFNPG
jgi:hypothetical protein